MILLNSSQQIVLFVSAAGVIQAVVLAGILFFHPKSDKSVNVFLSLHVLTISLFMLMPVVEYLFSWQSIIYEIPFHFLIGPFLYLYVRSFKEKIVLRKVWMHFILFVIMMILMLFYYLPWARSFPSSGKAPAEVLLAPVTYALVIVRNLQLIFYYFLARRELRSYQKSIHHLYSETGRVNLNWVNWLLNGYLMLIITIIALVYFVVNYPEKFSLFILVNTAIITPYIYVLTAKGIGQPTLWQMMPDKTKAKIEKEINEVAVMESTKPGTEHQQTGTVALPDPKIKEIVSAIVALMEGGRVYQEPELTLQNLADKLRVPSYQVSQAINAGMKKNFYDLINGYRVQEAKRLLLDSKNKNFTILSVGFEAGFNSKTTFNTVFKKFTGVTPSEFRSGH
jgi:AraC-like DNA-binding protein